MERMTETCKFDGQDYTMLKRGRTWIQRKKYPGNTDTENAIVQLSFYEDTDMTPDEINRFVERWKEAIELCGIFRQHNITSERIGELLNAEEDGGLVVLPCKVGDYLFAPTRNFVSTFIVTSFEVTQNYIFVNWSLQEGITGNFRLDCIPAHEIGKTVFLTREEAEAALAAMEGRKKEQLPELTEKEKVK